MASFLVVTCIEMGAADPKSMSTARGDSELFESGRNV